MPKISDKKMRTASTEVFIDDLKQKQFLNYMICGFGAFDLLLI